MERLFIHATEYTPMVHLDPSRGLIELKGNSNAVNCRLFYERIMLNLEEFVATENDTLTANLGLSYFNTSASKCLYDMLKRLNMIQKGGRKVFINWFHKKDDQEMKQVGQDYSRLFNLEFNFIEMVARQ